MPKQYPVARRAVLGAGGALILSAALLPTRSLAQTKSGAKMRIGIIGSGHIGGTIGGLWVKAGHPVMFSSRHPEELKDLVAGLGVLARAGSVDQAIAFGDVVFIAVPYGALPQIGRDYTARAQGQDRARCRQRRCRARRCHRRRGRARRQSASPRRSICPARGWCAPSTRSPT